MNKWIGLGNVGRDPESRKINETTVTKFSLATNKTFMKGTEKVTETQWHNIVMWGRLAEIASKYVQKGNQLLVEGEVQHRNYEDKEGKTVYVTEILASNMEFVGKSETKAEPPKANEQWKGKKEVKSMSDINDLPGVKQNEIDYLSDLPY